MDVGLLKSRHNRYRKDEERNREERDRNGEIVGSQVNQSIAKQREENYNMTKTAITDMGNGIVEDMIIHQQMMVCCFPRSGLFRGVVAWIDVTCADGNRPLTDNGGGRTMHGEKRGEPKPLFCLGIGFSGALESGMSLQISAF